VTDDLSLSNLSPASPRKNRKRVGRGLASGKGRYSGRGLKGQKSRAGSHHMRAGFEGGQMPIAMRMGKQRGNTSKDAMPIGPHRTVTQSLNVSVLEGAFEAGAEVTPEALREKGLIKSLKIDVKILGNGELTKKLAVSAHRFSESARAKIEGAGGSVVALRVESTTPSRKARKRAVARAAKGISQVTAATEDETPQADVAGGSSETPAEEAAS
jgi:large subunit ribosomal protein L15